MEFGAAVHVEPCRQQPASVWTYLGEENAELFERLKQTGISDLLNDKDTFWRLVPRQSLAGGVLNVPERTDITSGRENTLHFHIKYSNTLHKPSLRGARVLNLS